MLEVTRGRWLFELARLMSKHNTNFTDNCRQAAEEAITASRNYATLTEQAIRQLEDPDLLVNTTKLRATITTIQRASKPKDIMDASKEWSIANTAIKLRNWASSALPAQSRTSIKRGSAFQAEIESEEERGPRKRRNTKQITSGCEACGIRFHDLKSCWTAIPELRPEGTEPSKGRTSLVKKAINKDPKLKTKINMIRETIRKEQAGELLEKKRDASE